MREVAPGFQPGELRQPADGEPREDERRCRRCRRCIQAIFSDGLTYVSVFIEPYRADRHGEPMLASLGATQTLTQRQGDWWVTVVGDTPPATLRMFAAALERKKP